MPLSRALMVALYFPHALARNRSVTLSLTVRGDAGRTDVVEKGLECCQLHVY